MLWNWQLPEWPEFSYDRSRISLLERTFLQSVGGSHALLLDSNPEQRDRFAVEVLTIEGLKSSKIEGEILERESLRSSIQQHFGLKNNHQYSGSKEQGMADLMHQVYREHDQPLTHELLYSWHEVLFTDQPELENRGRYRTHTDPMQIVSNRLGSRRVYFEAPPSDRIQEEMGTFIDWFNALDQEEPLLGRAAIAHIYFESIHPFEDGNGRIGRALVEKIISSTLGRPTLIAFSQAIEKNRSAYYTELGLCNRTLQVDNWVEFFGQMILDAQNFSMHLLQFILAKNKMLQRLGGQLNSRQEKVLLRIFSSGLEGFKGGLSAENYMAITKASRATTTRDLSSLVEKGALRKTGQLRHTRYWLNIEQPFN